jgi:hypothetical protein
LGAGFVLTRHYVLTASHCLRSLASDDEHLELSFAGGGVSPGRVRERAAGADLALIDILKPHENASTVPHADRAGRGDTWFAPYRPSASDPYLSGDVLNEAIPFQCAAGSEIQALQLSCSQRLGDYAGYSGGPVERRVSDGNSALLGVLLEQYPDRQSAERASDVLFAATIAEALRCFNYLDVEHLLKILSGDNSTPAGRLSARGGPTRKARRLPREQHVSDSRTPMESRIAHANSLIELFRDWAASGTLNPLDVPILTQQVAQRLIKSKWVDDL